MPSVGADRKALVPRTDDHSRPQNRYRPPATSRAVM